MIIIMIEMQYSSVAILLLANPCIPNQNNGTSCHSYINHCLKRRCFVASYVVQIKNCLKITSAIKVAHYENYGQFPLEIVAITCLPQNQYFLCEQR